MAVEHHEVTKAMPLASRFVFVLGVCPRVGTHLVESVLLEHPRCARAGFSLPSGFWTFEDFLLEHADLLAEYARRTRQRWSDPWSDEDAERQLLAGIGEGLLEAYCELSDPPHDGLLISRSPSVRNLALISRVFPGSKAIVVVRHPRAVAASGAKTFGATRRTAAPAGETWIEQWRAGMNEYLSALEDLSLRGVLGVRYEDLLERREPTIRDLLAFLKLPDDEYDFDAARSVSERGSSGLRDGQEYMEWQPRDPQDATEYLSRGAAWSPGELARLQWMVGPQLEAMGYPPAATLSAADRMRNAALDRVRALERRAVGATDRVRHKNQR